MAVFVIYLNLRLRLSDNSSLFFSWIAGFIEDIFSGTILGVNASSKVTISLIIRFVSRKIEIGNFPMQIVIAIFLFAFDVVFKYVLITTILHIALSEQLIWSIILFKISINTILFVLISAILR